MENSLNENIEKKQPWYVPAIIFGGLEFCIPVLLVGGILVGSFSIVETIGILLIALVVFQWIGNAVMGYIGAKTGLTSSELAAKSFGSGQSKVFVSIVIIVLTLGWWAVQTSVAADALCALLAIDTSSFSMQQLLVTIVVGVLFAIPSVLGYASIKWVDYIAMPAGILLIIAAMYYAFENFGFETITSWNPESSMSWSQGINLIISVNVSQWLIASDYTRNAHPTWRDNILIPLGIIVVGFPLFLVGGIMSIGVGDADIVGVMDNLGFPAWGFIVLWIATWTSQLVSNYTGGLVLFNMTNRRTNRDRMIMTMLFAVAGIFLASIGIMSQFENFLYLTALLVPVIAGVVMIHFFTRKHFENVLIGTWNYAATLSVLLGIGFGYYTQYIQPIGIPAVQSLIFSGIVYYLLMKMRSGLVREKKVETS